MADCLANTGSGGLPVILLLAVAVVAVGAIALVIARARRRGPGGPGTNGSPGSGGGTVALALVLLGALGALPLAGAATPAHATSTVTANAGDDCHTPAPTAPPAPTPVIGPDQEVTFTSGGVTYYASFRGPTNPAKPVPAVVIVVGTGAVDRNGNAPTLNTEAYLWLADVLSAHGIASLRYDKLGTGQTGLGPYASDPDEMLSLGYDQLRVQPIRDALSFVAEQPGVDTDRVLLLGHSEGGADSLLVTTDLGDAPDLAGLLLIEPAYTHILDILSTQFSVQMDAAVEADVMTQADADTLKAWMADGIAQIRTGTPPYPDPGPAPLPDATGVTELYQTTIQTNIYGSDPAQMVVTHAMRTLYGKQFDQANPVLLSPLVTIPTLITCGSVDFNTPCGDGTPGSGVIAVAEGLDPALRTFHEIPGMVHILRDVGQAGVPEADQINYPFSSQLEAVIGQWVTPYTQHQN